MEIPIQAYLILACLMFLLGLYGVLFRKNLLLVLMSIELMLNAGNLVFVAGSRLHNNLDGQVMVLFVITIAACEAALGLAMTLGFYRKYGTVEVDFLRALRG